VPVLPATGYRSSGNPANAEAAVPALVTLARPWPTAARAPPGTSATPATRVGTRRTTRPLAGSSTARPTWGRYTVPPLARAP
jgi:hypothetical protein